MCWVGAVHAEPVPIGRYAEVHVGVSQRNPYATSGGDARRSGRSRARAPASAPRRRWGVTLAQARLLPPAVLADGTLIVGGAGGVQALDPDSGAERWFAHVGAVRFTPSITPDGWLVVVAANQLVLLSPAGSSRVLAADLRITGVPLLLDSGSMVVPGPAGQVQLLGADGTPLSTFATAAQQPVLRFTAWVGGDLVVLAGPSAEVSVLSLRDGADRTLRLAERVQTSPLVGDGQTLWLVGERGTLWEMGPDGGLHASVELGQGGATDDPALGWDGALRVGLRYGEIVCMEPGGHELWRRGVDGPPGPMLVDADDTLLFVGPRGVLYAIDREGELRWRQALGVRGAGRPVLGSDGTIYVVSRGGRIEAWR